MSDPANYWFQATDSYFIGKSLRFRGNQHLGPTRGGGSGDRNGHTLSFWFKSQKNNPYGNYFFGKWRDQGWRINNDPSNTVFQAINTDRGETASGTYPAGQWFHVFLTTNTLNNGQVWINGVQNNGTWKTPGNNFADEFYIGWEGYSNEGRLHALMADVHFIDRASGGSTSVTYSDFGERNAAGVWVPKKAVVPDYGRNGFHLDFSDPTNIGADRSGKGNNVSANGFQLTNPSGSDYDWINDGPS
jgi:hypothetical protein